MSVFADPSGTRMGAYEIVRELGRGGMGRVYLARDTGVADRPVAVKVILDGTTDDEATIRFLREIRNLGKLKHPGIVRVLAAGESQGRPYFVMDYVPGRDLARFLDECALLPERDRLLTIVRTIAHIARAVAYAHGQGVIHRDLKLPNIMVSHEDDLPVILDFGIAKYTGDSSLTVAGRTPGTPSYRAPEQLDERLKVRDELVDIWTIGVILYRCITGRMPFVGSDFVAVSLQILQQEVEFPAMPDSELARLVEPVIRDCLTKEPRRRPQSALDVADRLDAAVASYHRQVHAGPPRSDVTVDARQELRLPALAQRHPAVLLAALLGLTTLVLAAALLWIVLGQSRVSDRVETGRATPVVAATAPAPRAADEVGRATSQPQAAIVPVTAAPTPPPTARPTTSPTNKPTASPSVTPTASPSPTPRRSPTPSATPSAVPTPSASARPTATRSPVPTAEPPARAADEAAVPAAGEHGGPPRIQIVPFDTAATRKIRFTGSVDDIATAIVDDINERLQGDDVPVAVGTRIAPGVELVVRGRITSVDGGDRAERTMLGGIGIKKGAACLTAEARIETRSGEVLRELSFDPCARFAPFLSGESLLRGHASDVARDIVSAVAEIQGEKEEQPEE